MSLIEGMNPTAVITTEPQAKAAARASAISILIGVIWGAISLAWMMSPEAQALMREAMASAETAETAGMADMIVGMMVAMAGLMIALQLVFALVQWFKPNIVIPIIFLLLIAYGLLTTILGLVMADQMAAITGPQPEMPLWQTGGYFVVLIIQLVLQVAGLRGANALSRMRRAGAETTA